jgi:hypothetical protein
MTAWILAALALALAIWVVRLRARARALDDSLRALRSEAYAEQFDLRDKVTSLEEEILKLRFAERRRAGTLRVTPGTTMGEALAMHPLVQPLLESFATAGCSIREVSSQQTLEQTAQDYKVDVAAMVAKLQALLDDPDHFQMPARGEVRVADPGSLIQIDFKS